MIETDEKSKSSLAKPGQKPEKLMRDFTRLKAELAQYRQRYGSIGVNRKYKDSVFANLFSETKYAFMLYQDLHPEDSGATEEELEVVTIENIFTNDLYNDAAFKVGGRVIVLMEHQSTYSFNMPMRMLLYIAEEYSRLLDSSMDLLYRENAVKVPAPEFYVVYTGKWKSHYKAKLQLSDLFAQQSPALELKVPVIYEPKEASILWEYVGMVKKIEAYIEAGEPKMAAIEKVVSEYQDSRYRISDFLRRRKDVSMMFNRDITLEEMIDVRAREQWERGREEGEIAGRREGEITGRREGKREGRIEGEVIAYYKCGVPVRQIASQLSISEQYIYRILNENS